MSKIKQHQHNNWVGCLGQSKYLIFFITRKGIITSPILQTMRLVFDVSFSFSFSLLDRPSPSSADFAFSVSATCCYPPSPQHIHPSYPMATILPALHSTYSQDSDIQSGSPFVLSPCWSSIHLLMLNLNTLFWWKLSSYLTSSIALRITGMFLHTV